MAGKDQDDFALMPLERAGHLLRKRKISPVELTEASLRRVKTLNPRLNAFITIAEESARAHAKRAEKEITSGKYRGPLHGIPITLKDNVITPGMRTTAGSKFFAPPQDSQEATVAGLLRRAGAIVIGKTNLHEFAYGVTTANPHFGVARNPWDTERIPGGSSGGSAVAVAAGMGFASIGTDTGGSIRIPSTLCGIVGLKATFGRVSCFGVVPLAKTLDHTGPIARSVSDAALMLHAVAGYDLLDPASERVPTANYLGALRGKIKRARIGFARGYFSEYIDPEVRRAVEAAIQQFEKLGAKAAEVCLPDFGGTTAASTAIALAEASEYHRRAGFFPGRADEYGGDVRERLETGLTVTAIDYIAALAVRERFTKLMDSVFQQVDAVLVPGTSVPAPRIGDLKVSIEGREETVRSALIRLNRPANFTGHPAITLPCGFTRAGLPVGLQIIGRRWDEAGLLRIAHAYEQATEWHERKPDLAGELQT